MAPCARQGCLNSNHNDKARVNLELYISLNITTIFASMKSVPTYRYFLGSKDICAFLAYHNFAVLVNSQYITN